MYFTQFLFPHGRPKAEHIDMPEEVETLAKELNAAGWSFEIECFPSSQKVHADCCDEEGPLANGICDNGPSVPTMIARLVRDAHAEWTRRGKPGAKGDRQGEIARKMQAYEEDCSS